MATKTGGWATNDVPTAAEINTYFQQRDAWTSYTPTLTNVTTGNGTLTAYYNQQGRIVDFAMSFTLGSTSSITGLIGVALPVTAARTWTSTFIAYGVDSGVTVYPLAVWWGTTSRLDLYAMNSAGTYVSSTATSSTVPWSWGNTDYFLLAGTFEAASAP